MQRKRDLLLNVILGQRSNLVLNHLFDLFDFVLLLLLIMILTANI